MNFFFLAGCGSQGYGFDFFLSIIIVVLWAFPRVALRTDVNMAVKGEQMA